MKELKRLERRIYWSGCFHLGLLTPCLSLSAAMLFREEDPIYWIIWALGTVIPVQLIRIICERTRKKQLQALLSLGVFVGTMAVSFRHYRWISYLVSCIPILISGLLLPRKKGRVVFAVPTFFHLVIPYLLYAFGQIMSVILVARIAIILFIFMVLNCFFYMNQSRLLTDIRLSADTEISVSGLIRQNRKVVACFLIAGTLVLIAIPFILREHHSTTPEELNQSTAVEAAPAPTAEPLPDYNYRESSEGEPIDLDSMGIVSTVIFAASAVIIAFLGLAYLLYIWVSNLNERKPNTPDIENDMIIERLEPDSANRDKEHLSGYERKIRRHYEKLIRKRAPKEARLTCLTPTELEQAAEVSGDGAETVHEIYSRTRYSSEPAAKEHYAAFRDAVRALPNVSQSEKNGSGGDL